MFLLKFVLIEFSVIAITTSSLQINSNFKQIYNSSGDVNIVVILRNCQNNSLQSPYVTQSLINSAIWIVDRVNFLKLIANVEFGLTINEICNEKDKYQAIFQTFEQDKYQIGIVSDFKIGPKLRNFIDILNLNNQDIVKFHNFLIDSAVEFLANFHFANITIEAPHEFLLEEFSKTARKRSICIRNYHVFQNWRNIDKNTTATLVLFGYYHQLYSFIQNYDDLSNITAIFLPLDGSIFTELPPNCYLITPPHYPLIATHTNSINILPTPIFFEIALPILNYVQNSQFILIEICNDTQFKWDCLKNELKQLRETCTEPLQILDLLRIETLKSDFVYNIYRMENQTTYNKIANYHIFDGNLTIFESMNLDLKNTSIKTESCEDFQLSYRIFESNPRLWLKNDSWVFAFLSISLLGILFCIAIFIFFIVCIFRKDILEGNPILTLLLLLTVLLMFCSILPLCLDGSKTIKNSLCLVKSLSITLSFAGAFSLILSRCIVLATASKEIGFMAHIAGPVQSFLCLFIFGVQGALSLQIVYRCHDTFHSYSFVYLLSYNMSLLLLLLCICPLVYRSQRNYREGKYFTIAIILITILWSIWIPNFIIFNENYRDLILCFGLISTAIVLLATIFVPRTYLMTIAVARNKLTSTLPSLATTTSVIDIYRAGNQSVYDCVNVAAINRCSLSNLQQPDLYNCPELPQNDEDFEQNCASSINSDKVTRF